MFFCSSCHETTLFQYIGQATKFFSPLCQLTFFISKSFIGSTGGHSPVLYVWPAVSVTKPQTTAQIAISAGNFAILELFQQNKNFFHAIYTKAIWTLGEREKKKRHFWTFPDTKLTSFTHARELRRYRQELQAVQQEKKTLEHEVEDEEDERSGRAQRKS